jgi:hypothetical protein
MGSQATVIIRTDAASEIKHNAQEFVDNMLCAINRVACTAEPTDFGAGTHCNPAQVVNYNHCDSTSIIAAGGSRGLRLGTIFRWKWPDDRSMVIDVIKELMQLHGITTTELTWLI